MPNRAEIEIRRYEPSDLAQMVAVAESLPEWFTSDGLRKLRTDLQFQAGFVAVREDDIVGFLSFCVNEGIAVIGWMAVRPELHRQGIGRRLVEQLIAEVRPAGVSEIQVDTLGDSVEYEPYARSRAFYRAIGFRDLRRVQQNNPECPERLTLAKPIS